MSTSRKRRFNSSEFVLLEGQVKKANKFTDTPQDDQPELSLQHLTPQERLLWWNLFKFNEIVAIQFWSIWELEFTRSIKVIWWGWKILDAQTSPFVLCYKWFSSGKETESHKRDHDYYILDRMEFPLFIESWSAYEELMLLKSIFQWGIDNWVEISDQLYNKSPSDWDAHFYSFYYKSQEDPVPNLTDIWVINRDKNTHKATLKEKILKQNQKK